MMRTAQNRIFGANVPAITSFWRLLLLLIIGVPMRSPASIGAPPDFDRYAIILERSPFGLPTVAHSPSSPPPSSPVAPAVAAAWRLCALTDSSSGLRIGLIDLSEQPPRSYLAKVGDTVSDVTLCAADYQGEWVELRDATGTWRLSLAASGIPPASEPTPVARLEPPDHARGTDYAQFVLQRRQVVAALSRHGSEPETHQQPVWISEEPSTPPDSFAAPSGTDDLPPASE